jgi:hypothetical protein
VSDGEGGGIISSAKAEPLTEHAATALKKIVVNSFSFIKKSLFIPAAKPDNIPSLLILAQNLPH